MCFLMFLIGLFQFQFYQLTSYKPIFQLFVHHNRKYWSGSDYLLFPFQELFEFFVVVCAVLLFL